MIVLIDGDILVYEAGYASEQAIDWGDGEFTLSASLPEAARTIDAQIEGIKVRTDADRVVVALSDTQANFRKDVWPTYKAQRSNKSARKAKPIVFKGLREHLRQQYEVVQRPRLEADDVMGILATGEVRGFLGNDKVIASIDKDMLTVPGTVYNWRTEKWTETSLDEADHNFFVQVLTGDATDNYPGCPGVGPVKAKRLLEPWSTNVDRWAAVLLSYGIKGLTEADAIAQARCARILRYEDYDFEKKEPRLWTPTTAA